MSDIGGEQLRIHGPPGTLNFLSSLRYFVKRPDLSLKVNQSNVMYSDNNLSISSIPIVSSSDVPHEDPEEENVVANVGWLEKEADGTFNMGLGKKGGKL